METKKPVLTDRFLQALNLAFKLHENQTRKAGGKNKSYFGTHLLAVCSYVQEVDGTEDEAIAAILHDSVEDQVENLLKLCAPNPERSDRDRALAYLSGLFGANVAGIIDALTDEKLPANWKDTSRDYRQNWIKESVKKKAEKLTVAAPSVRLVKSCDVLHNTRAILQERTENGPKVWGSFALGCAGTIWKAETMTEVFEQYGPAIPAIELRKAVNSLKAVSKGDLNLKISK